MASQELKSALTSQPPQKPVPVNVIVYHKEKSSIDTCKEILTRFEAKTMLQEEYDEVRCISLHERTGFKGMKYKSFKAMGFKIL